MPIQLVQPAVVDFSGIGDLPGQYMQAQNQAQQLRSLAEKRDLEQQQRAAIGAFDPAGDLTQQVTNLARVGAVQPGQALGIIQQQQAQQQAKTRQENIRRALFGDGQRPGVLQRSGLQAADIEAFALMDPEEALKAYQEARKGTDDIQEYNFVRQQGYGGTFRDFMLESKRAGATSINNNNFKIPAGYQQGADGASVIPIPGGPADPTNPKNITEGQRAASLYASRAQQAEDEIAKLGGFVPNEMERGLSEVPGVGNRLVSENFQRFDQAQRNFINAILRRESGAVIAETEFDNANKQYFPQPGDSNSVIKQKARNRKLAVKELTQSAGGAIQPSGGPSNDDPLGLR